MAHIGSFFNCFPCSSPSLMFTKNSVLSKVLFQLLTGRHFLYIYTLLRSFEQVSTGGPYSADAQTSNNKSVVFLFFLKTYASTFSIWLS